MTPAEPAVTVKGVSGSVTKNSPGARVRVFLRFVSVSVGGPGGENAVPLGEGRGGRQGSIPVRAQESVVAPITTTTATATTTTTAGAVPMEGTTTTSSGTGSVAGDPSAAYRYSPTTAGMEHITAAYGLVKPDLAKVMYYM